MWIFHLAMLVFRGVLHSLRTLVCPSKKGLITPKNPMLFGWSIWDWNPEHPTLKGIKQEPSAVTL